MSHHGALSPRLGARLLVGRLVQTIEERRSSRPRTGCTVYQLASPRLGGRVLWLPSAIAQTVAPIRRPALIRSSDMSTADTHDCERCNARLRPGEPRCPACGQPRPGVNLPPRAPV